MQQIISNENIQLLEHLMNKENKTLEDLKQIYELIKNTSFFNKVFEQYEQGISVEGVYKLCNFITMERFTQNQVILLEGDVANDKVYLIVKGKTMIFQLAPLDDFTTRYLIFKDFDTIDSDHEYGTFINILSAGDLFGEKATFQKETIGKRSASVISKDQTICIVINKSKFDQVFQYFGEQFQNKHNSLCKLIPELGNMSSKKMLETLINQFEDLNYPNSTFISLEGLKGEYMYFLANGQVTFSKKQVQVCDLDCAGVIGDELLIDPDNDFSKSQISLCIVVSNQNPDLSEIVSKYDNTSSNPAIQLEITIANRIPNCQQFTEIRTKGAKQKIINQIHNKTINQISYQIPKQSLVLKFNKKKRDRFFKNTHQVRSKITMNEFVQLTKKAEVPQIQLLQKVENPYDFASNVNSQGFLKQYYANLIRVGLVKPEPIQEPQDNDKIQRARVKSALRIVNYTAIKTRRASSTSNVMSPMLQITAYRSNVSNEKQSQESTLFYQTPRTYSQPNLLNYYTPIHTPTCKPLKPSTASSKTNNTTKSQIFNGTTKSQVFRPTSGFMDHSSRLSQCSEINRRLKRPNQYF